MLKSLPLKNWYGKLCATKHDVAEINDRIRVATAEIISSKYNLEPTEIRVDSGYPSCNPGLCRFDNRWVLVARSSNKVNYNDGDYRQHGDTNNTTNRIVILDDDFTVHDSHPLDDSILRHPGSPAEFGFQDSRLFQFGNDLYGIAAGIGQHAKFRRSITQIIFKISGNIISDYRPLPSPHGHIIERNWSPLVIDKRLFVFYSTNPPIAIEVRSGDIALDRIKNFKGHFDIRGGTPYLPWKDGFLSIGHLAPIHLDGRKHYLHTLILLDKEFRLLETSEPFFFQRRGIEFACGLAHHDGCLIVSYGVADRGCRILPIPTAVIDRMLVT